MKGGSVLDLLAELRLSEALGFLLWKFISGVLIVDCIHSLANLVVLTL
jgi:hypothetical protein